MKQFLTRWYNISLPKREPDTTPEQRERTRYAQLTSSFLLLVFVLYLLVAPFMIFDSPRSPSSPPIAYGMLAFLLASFVLGRIGRQIASAICIIGYVFLVVIGPLVTNPLDPTLVPLLHTLVIAIILAGALMPPVAALIAGLCSALASVFITVVPILPRTPAYQQMLNQQLYTVSLVLPLSIQITVAVVTFVIMRNLIRAIRRADRAEEIAQLRQEIVKQTQVRANEQEQLAEGIAVIAQVHARIANGDMHARVPLNADNVLWQVAVPLNNLLNRLQGSKEKADQFDRMSIAIHQLQQQMELARLRGQAVQFPRTGTLLDAILMEYQRNTTSLPVRNYKQEM
ncbi:MAG TPA: hypothetical protein DHW02_08770 [Ktedonobacter sp.]|nr:hypothetical protein [Ktedonobacter sp.]